MKYKDFLDDKEKMEDFYVLSKEEFLNSYSYLTEEEYDLTEKNALYVVRDCQFDCRYFSEGHIFKTKVDIIEHLAEYHDIDFEGVDENDNFYEDIHEFLNKEFNTEQEKLNWLLDYGEWELENPLDNCYMNEEEVSEQLIEQEIV